MDCMWNDSNEYNISTDDCMLELSAPAIQDALTSSEERRKDIGLWGRAMHCEIMAKASHDALLAARPKERPFVITRSATAGTMKYAASSGSGKNSTSWDGMRGANALSLTAGMCLLQNYGHDIGGFEGPRPTPELLLRWIQLGIHSPRFAITCKHISNNNKNDEVIEPWMYPTILPEIRKAIRRRYEIIPYLYSLMLQSHFSAIPTQRWVGWGYETDSEVWTSKVLKDGETQYWLGDTLLVGGVYEAGVDEAKVYLPKRTGADRGYFNLNAPYQYIPAGQWATISSPWKQSIPLLARVGGCIPVGRNHQTCASSNAENAGNLPPDDWRGVEIFPPPEEQCDDSRMFMNDWRDDDGVSPPPAKVARFYFVYAATAKNVAISFRKDISEFNPPWVQKGLTIIMPVGDAREVVSAEGGTVEPRRQDESGRKRWHLLHQPSAEGSKT